jgi:hypothetical protein
MERSTGLRDTADLEVKSHDYQVGGSAKYNAKNRLMGNMVALNTKARGSGIDFAEQYRLF